MLAAALGACGPLPQPFRGEPGRVARMLARPPAYRLAVTPPTDALLTDGEGETLSRALADALVAQEVPATAGERLPLDWEVVVSVTRQGANVTPYFVLRDADGRPLGDHAGRALPAREWAEGGAPVFGRVATEAAPALATLAARADAQRRTGDERAAGRGPPVVRLLAVRGAPGDGNRSLTTRMGERLAGLGFQVQDASDGAEFAVGGVVSMVPIERAQQRVEIVWTVSRRDGYDLGRVLQLNQVPAGSLNGLWGDVAYVVAEEAAGGVRDVIANAGTVAEAPQGAPTRASAGAPTGAPAASPAPARPRR